jgi:hypothetical protein
MLQHYIAEQFEAALLQLKNEINNYTHKENIWKLQGEIKNPGGTLALHLIGNLNHFICAVLGNTGYVRDRDAEFSRRNVSSSEIIKNIDEVTYNVKIIVSNLTDEQLFGDYPLNDGKPAKITTERLVQLLAHLNYHVGQINYHRRMIEQPVSIADDVRKL